MTEERSPIARLLRAGEAVAHATGVDAAVDQAVEEAVLRALRSPAIDEAITRLVHEHVLEDEELWRELVDSRQLQLLIERVASAPEIRDALAAQSAGLITDIGVKLTRITEKLDDAVERVVAGGRHEEETNQAGLATRGLAAAIDAGIALLLFSLGSAVFASVLPGDGLSLVVAIVLAVLGFGALSAIVVGFWSLAGQTPGMRFLAIRIEINGSEELGVRLAIRRWIGLFVALAPAGLGVLAILRDPRRRGWHDRIAGTEVVYDAGRRRSATQRAA